MKISSFGNLFAYGFVVFAVLGGIMSLVEAYKFFGFFSKHLHISTGLIINVAFVFGLAYSLLNKKMKTTNRIYNYLFKVNRFFLPLTAFLFLFFKHLQDLNGINYVYSAFHIQPQNLVPTIILSSFVAFIDLYLSLETQG